VIEERETMTNMSGRTMGRFGVHGALALLLSLGTAGFGGAQTAEELLGAHAEALGGKATLAAVRTLRRAGATTFESPFTGRLDGQIELEIVAGEKVYRSSDMGIFTTTTVWDGSRAWEQGPQGFRELAGDELRLIRQSSLPFLTAGVGLPDGMAATREKDRDLDGVLHHVLTLEDGEGGRATVFLNPETRLATRAVYAVDLPNLGPTEIVEERLEYAEHGGILFPSRVRVSIPGILTSETQFDETAIDPAIDPQRFASPQ
jgi:hypothetical protein